MKLNKYKKLLKEEFEDTINPIEIKEEKKNYNFNHKFKFKFRYVFLPLLAVLLLYLIIDQISVSITNEEIKKYNDSITNEKIDYDSINISEKRYESKLELENAIVKYESKQRKELKKSTLEKIFSIRLIGCTSEKSNSAYHSSPREESTTDSNSSYDTNVVEKSVDEADVSKCDGAYIYSLYENNIYIYDLAGNVVLTKEFLNYPLNMYVYNDKVVIIFEKNVNIYEFSNSKLELKTEYDNHLVNSRLYKNNLFMVFFEKLDLDKINYDNCYYDGTINPNFVYKIFKIDLNNLEAIEANLVTTYNNQFYMSENYIYFTSYQYSYSWGKCDYTNFFIIDHNLNGYSCFKENGYLLNKYSMSEYEGYFRFLMIDTYSKKFYNTLYTYDLEKKENASKLEEIGLEYEYAKSIRFDKEKCYVCTFRTTDPLYLIDLSDPYDIKIVSELHVTGYSDYLHYFKIKDETYILGVGYNESRMPKLSIYKEENNALIQYKNNLIISYYVNDKMISFENEKYLKVDDSRYLNDNAIGYFFYVKDDIIYFGSQLGASSYYMFKIDVESDELFTVYDKYETEQTCVFNYKGYAITYLRCYLIENKLYYFGDGNIIIIKDF